MEEDKTMDLELRVESKTAQKIVEMKEGIRNKTINVYSSVHSGPFIVMVQGRHGNIGHLHPMKLGKILYDKGGYNINNIKRVGRNKLEIRFNSYADANTFTRSDISSKYDLDVYIPSYYTQVIGIIRGVDVDLTVEEIKTNKN